MTTYKIACGMYAPTEAIKNCWRSLFRHFSIDSAAFIGKTFEPVFRTDNAVYVEDDVLIGHTCGYPYIKTWQSTHTPLCAPIFDFDGCRGKEYSSWLISHRDNPGETLQDFKNKTVAINGYNSNSGMNVLRHDVARIAGGKSFFNEVVVSGGHLASIEMISNQNAELAAIDTVTYALLAQEKLFHPGDLKIIGQSAFTSPLPFIARKETALDRQAVTTSFNRALEKMDYRSRSRLGLTRFETVGHEDYRKIRDMEEKSVQLGTLLNRPGPDWETLILPSRRETPCVSDTPCKTYHPSNAEHSAQSP